MRGFVDKSNLDRYWWKNWCSIQSNIWRNIRSLFFRPPGCGTWIVAYVVLRIEDVIDKARADSPCILLFDELDSIAKA
ncbi:unnamed protein product [Caenorhabditis angaria]|uniref:ATPase AAA-type core domain-containing protein n=1 Tax=Caenorhabditis angaria TaxID=860376 RepID=A0A9P1IZB0_9PELO|nr:unnamed protein product [Caenorhabditis angaria]